MGLTATLLAFALFQPGGDTPAAIAPPAADTIRELIATPARIELANAFESVQLVVTALLTDGSRVDVTRAMHFEPSAALVRVDPRGRVAPAADGEGSLAATIGDKSLAIPLAVRGAQSAYDPSFVNDVIPVMTRLGCNAGTCHGSAKGKNGFKLSLRGYDPAFDHMALTDELAGRRFNRAVAEQSLFLLKPTASVPHEGGQRMLPGSRDYELLRRWVESGVKLDTDAPHVASIAIVPENPSIPLPGMAQQFAVVATYADGRTRDVTGDSVIESNDTEVATVETGGLVTALRRGDVAVLARYSGRYAATRLLVMGDRKDFSWKPVTENNWIDEMVDSKLAALRANPSGTCSDAEFLRRLSLDLTGQPPTSREVRAFLADQRDSKVKREEMVERLIGSVEFVEHWTNKWSDLLQVNSKFLGGEGAARLREWIREQIASNRPYDQFAAAVLDGTGSTWQNPPAAYWKVLRKPDVAMENTTQLFLGVRFSCNKCHDHPFERWTQDQHWALAAFFAQVGRTNVPGQAVMPRGFDNRPDDEEITVEEMVKDMPTGEVMHPNKNVVVAPSFPFEVKSVAAHMAANATAAPATTNGASAAATDVPGGGTITRRAELVSWVTAPDNPYFAKSYVNRLWSYFLGVGLIEPVDDIRASNPPTNPELLDRMTQSFVDSNFDVRALMRLICHSAVYQRSLATNEWNGDDTLHYAHATARRLPAESLFDALRVATGHDPEVAGAAPDARAAEFLDPSVATQDNFLALFGRPPRESACECERTSGMSLGQALSLVNGPTLAESIDDPNNAIARYVAYEKNPRKVVDELYVRFLARPATDAEFAAVAPSFDPDGAANVATLPPADLEQYRARRTAFEASLPKVIWQPLADLDVRSAAGATFTKLPDGSWLAGGARADKDTYTLLAHTTATAITGMRLDVLPDPSLPGGGAGRSDSGNFVLGELRVATVALAGSAGTRNIALQNATADFSQQQFTPEAIADGNPVTGWAIYPNTMQPHRAVWEFGEDAGDKVGGSGSLLVITIDQGWGAGHLLGRFKLSITTSPRPVRVSMLGDAVLASLSKPADQRSPDDESALHRLFLSTAPDLRERMRLASAQDLAWALATSPAFLFSR